METKPAGEFTTILGSDASFKGELTFENALRIDGKFDGQIRSKGSVTIATKGSLKGDVQAGKLVVEGNVEGNLSAEDRIELRGSARVKGDIRASKLSVAEGAAFSGMCQVGGEAGAVEIKPSPPRAPEREAPVPPRPSEVPVRK